VTIAIAHRGDPVGHRENTLAAFRSAVALGADMVEIDLRRTRDGHIVVLHDPTLDRLWDVPRAVSEMDLTEIRSIGTGGPDQGIPTFAEVLDAVTLPLMVDFTKREVVPGALSAVIDAGAHAMSQCLFVTGNIEALRLLRSLSSVARIGLTWVEDEPPPMDLLDELGAEFWNPMFSRVTPERVAAVHASGRLVSCWTVDDERDMTAMARAGVDAIVSNQIARLCRTLGTGRGPDAPARHTERMCPPDGSLSNPA
jgi:glycerophosphoryl diester phosphodiesterase